MEVIIKIVKDNCLQTEEKDVHPYLMKKIMVVKDRATIKFKILSEIHSNLNNTRALYNKCQQKIVMIDSD